jgi:primosomal protein N''
MFRKVIAQTEIYPDYNTTLTKADFDNNESKIDVEIKNIESKYPLNQQIAVNVTFDNKEQKLDQFLKLLKQQLADIKEKKDIRNQYNTNLFHNIDGENIDVSSEDAREGLKRDIASLERQIQEREETLAEIDNYVVTLLTGEMGQLNIAHTNAKFVKIADQPTEEEVLDPVEDYFNKLYDDTPGSPNMGKLMTHPEKHRDQLSTEAQTQTSKPKFIKK